VPITKAQARDRSRYIGSTDIAPLFGQDPFRTAYDVWLEKTRQAASIPENEAMQAGRIFERAVLEYAEEQLGSVRVNCFRRRKGTHLGAHIDAIIQETREPLEAKTAGLYGPIRENWGEFGSDEVPPRVILQCHGHMLAMESRPTRCHVAVFLGGRGFGLYQIPYVADLGEMILERIEQFWADHVEARIPPPGCLPSEEIVRRMQRIPDKSVAIPETSAMRVEVLRYLAGVVDEKLREAKTELLRYMGDAEIADAGRWGVWTYFQQERNAINVKRLRAEAPEIAQRFQEKSSVRVLRRRKPEDGQCDDNDVRALIVTFLKGLLDERDYEEAIGRLPAADACGGSSRAAEGSGDCEDGQRVNPVPVGQSPAQPPGGLG